MTNYRQRSTLLQAVIIRRPILGLVLRRGPKAHPTQLSRWIHTVNPISTFMQQSRAGGERPFATYKSRYGLARTRFMGLAKNMTAYGIAAIAHNLRKGAKFLSLYGLPDPNYAG